MTTRRFRGRSQSTPCRLWTRAPRIAIGSSLARSQAGLAKTAILSRRRPARRPACGTPARAVILRGSAAASRQQRRGIRMSCQEAGAGRSTAQPAGHRDLREGRQGGGQARLRAGAGALRRAHRGPSRGAGPAGAGALLPGPLRAGAGEKRPAFRPKTFDETCSTTASTSTTAGEYEEALKFLRQAAEIHPRTSTSSTAWPPPPPGRATAPPPSRRCARRCRPARPTGPRPAATPTSTPCARTRSSSSIVYPQAS